MAETVRGSIGTDQVILENAATEATLLKLLEAVQQSGGSAAAARVASTAGAAGVNVETVKKANENLSWLTKTTQAAAGGLGNLYKELISGQPSVSGVLAGFGSLPGPLGFVARNFALLAQFQETNMKAYQSVTQSGVNFGGSLTELRTASTMAYVSLDQFTNIIKNNSRTLAMMGGTANEGAVAFAAMSNQLIGSQAGSKLLALGYTAEDVNNGMLNYIAITGGRTKDELANSAKITASTAAYLEELDKVAQFTGANRKAMEEEQKKAAAQAAFQRKMQSLGEAERLKLQTAYDAAAASGIAGATDAVMSVALGMPPLTKEAQQFAGTLPNAYNGLTNMTNTAMRTGSSMDDVRKANGQFVMGAVDGAKQLGATGDALSLQGNKTITGALALQNQMNAKGIKTADEYAENFKQIGKKQAEQATSQAATMADAEKQLKEFGQVLMSIVGPIVAFLTPALKFLGPALIGLSIAVIAFKTAMATWAAFVAAKNAIRAAGGGVSGAAGAIVDRIRGAPTPPPAPPGPGGVLGGLRGGPPSPGPVPPAPGGGGGGFVGFIKALGRGLASLAPIAVPMLIGAGAVAGVIALLGAGVAAAIALIGLGLPTFAKGIKELTDIDGLNLAKVAFGLAALGPAMVLFAGSSIAAGLMTAGSKIINFFSGGGPISMVKSSVEELTPILPQLAQIGPAINSYASGIVAFGKAVNTVDIAKAERLKEVMKGPGVLEGIGSAIRDVGAATSRLVSGTTANQSQSSNDIQALNTTMKEILRYVRDTAEHTKNTHTATRSLNPNLFAN